jgi:hypothetical protein
VPASLRAPPCSNRSEDAFAAILSLFRLVPRFNQTFFPILTPFEADRIDPTAGTTVSEGNLFAGFLFEDC